MNPDSDGAIFDNDKFEAWVIAICDLNDDQLDEAFSLSGAAYYRYREMRIGGQSHNIALMLATKTFPGAKTDSIFNEGKFSGQNAHGCHSKELYLRQLAEKQGFSTNGKWYCSGLASYPGDPDGWVSGRGDVEAVCRKKNFTILDGYVKHTGHEVAPKPDIDVDPRLIHSEAKEIMETHPGARYGDVYERVHELRTGKIDPNPARVKTPTEDW